MRVVMTVKQACTEFIWPTYSLILLTILLVTVDCSLSDKRPISTSSSSRAFIRQDFRRSKQNFISRLKRNVHSSRPPVALTYTIDMFGGTYKLQLRQTLVASEQLKSVRITRNGTIVLIPGLYGQSHCHYAGTVTTCQPTTRHCYDGQAAMSRFAHGLRGVMKIGGEDILIEPLPETLLAKRMRFSNVHIARRKVTDDIQESEKTGIQDLLDKLSSSLDVSGTSLDVRPLSNPPNLLNVEVGVFVDLPMVQKLREIYPDEYDQITLILSAYNAVNMLYSNITIGRIKVRLLVKHVLLDESGTMPNSEKVTEYLNDLCRRYQREILKKLKIVKNWDLTTALTGLDVYADAVDVTRDEAYKNLRGSAKKIFTVSGVSYGGGMCSFEKNCMVAEFSLLFGNIETIAHEAGHTLGMYHDGSGNTCDRKGNRIMSIQRPQRQRSGWSTCSVESLRKFVVSGHASCLINKHATA
ncbi:hypothetical protein BV898_10433 [Hypsibius exemplaris]|uniref:Peptidase M12B domain-containing protein n=1 Tax=Hypsibius exemplaris TaxID=2072580 RepID=A0A1W0WJN5_HYPEX|nr:hypothetical protein BV898_10433 [Hypsibius exemplaris]